jgi:hypothetical protein
VATEKQFAANRQNAQKSTGPKTPEGRAAVRLNGVKHGLTAETLVLKGENQADFTDLLNSYEAEHAPTTPTEEALVVQLAMATWRLRRLYHQEAGFYTYQVKSLEDIGKDLKLDEPGQMARAAGWGENTLALFNRLEGRLERTFYRALHELKHLRKERDANLGSVCQTTVGQVPDLPSSQSNDIPAPPPDPDHNPSVTEGAEPRTSEIHPPPDPQAV